MIFFFNLTFSLFDLPLAGIQEFAFFNGTGFGKWPGCVIFEGWAWTRSPGLAGLMAVNLFF